jgi:predicted phosphoribosyltransferase
MPANQFTDRAQAGRVLAQDLDHYAGEEDLLVLALPRGGVAVACEVAAALGAPLEVYGGDASGRLARCTVILVDDGLAAASVLHAAIESLRRAGPSAIVVAMPVATPDACARLRREADEVVCSVIDDWQEGVWYREPPPAEASPRTLS